MDKCEYQILRSSVETIIHDALADTSISDVVLANNLMRVFLLAMANSEARNCKAKRDFLTFRRNSNLKPPAWAYRKPGIDSRLPKL